MPFSWPVRCCLVAYYYGHFFMEEHLLAIARRSFATGLVAKTRLASAEFLACYAVHLYVLTVLIPGAGEELRETCYLHEKCHRHLWGEAWLPLDAGDSEYWLDFADIQWRSFRAALGILVPVAALLSGVVRLAGLLARRRCPRHAGSVAVLSRLLVGVVFTSYVHGLGVCFLIATVVLFFAVSGALAGTRLAVPVTWALALLAIFAKESNFPIRRHLRFGSLLGDGLAFLDSGRYHGQYDWALSLNLMVLRLVSFALDRHAATERSGYTFARCLSHAFYAPLWIAGPTIRFDDYLSQCLKHTGETQQKRVDFAWYLAQLLAIFLAIEGGLQLFPVFAIARSGLFPHLGPRLGAYAVFVLLNIMWLKFAMIWRVARAWALADGIDPPENMLRALCNTFSVKSFWQCWHASYNRWLVRYIYVPAGGRDSPFAASALTFAFVALWHDVEAKLLAWGCLNAVFIFIEGRVVAAVRRMKRLKDHVASRERLETCGAVLRIVALMAVNMIGYAVGVGGVSGYLAGGLSALGEGLQVVAAVFVILYSGTRLMQEIRRIERMSMPPDG